MDFEFGFGCGAFRPASIGKEVTAKFRGCDIEVLPLRLVKGC